jgi:endonuclease III
MSAGYHPEPSRQDRTQYIVEIVDRLAGSYGAPCWKPSGKPVDELVMTILSQNTSDANTDRGYRSLRQSFPTWQAARDADVSAIADSIRTAGLADQKAPRIQSAFRDVLACDSEDPNTRLLTELTSAGPLRAKQRLTSLNGVGPKTAACVLLFAAGLPALPVDTHVHRVSRRLGLIGPKVNAERARKHLEAIVPPELVYAFHVLLIQHGRRICRARKPRCWECTLSGTCPSAVTSSREARSS